MTDGTKPDKEKLSVERIRPAYQQVADRIREAILDGRIAPGERLPVEMDLTQLFGVSRSTVREALRTLSSLNLVTTSRGITGGTYVSHPDPDAVSQYLEVCIGLMSDANVVSVTELTETRKLLEVRARRLSHRRRVPGQRTRGSPVLVAGNNILAAHRCRCSKPRAGPSLAVCVVLYHSSEQY